MFFWNHPIGQKIFSMTAEVAESSSVLAMNQGLYNGFLAAGLFWGLLTNHHFQDLVICQYWCSFQFLLCLSLTQTITKATTNHPTAINDSYVHGWLRFGLEKMLED
jgi:uncharacterized membrane protein